MAIWCAAVTACALKEWFHYECVGLKAPPDDADLPRFVEKGNGASMREKRSGAVFEALVS